MRRMNMFQLKVTKLSGVLFTFREGAWLPADLDDSGVTKSLFTKIRRLSRIKELLKNKLGQFNFDVKQLICWAFQGVARYFTSKSKFVNMKTQSGHWHHRKKFVTSVLFNRFPNGFLHTIAISFSITNIRHRNSLYVRKQKQMREYRKDDEILSPE